MAIYFNDEAQSKAAHVINTTEITDASRVSISNISGSSIATIWDMGTFDKKVSGSIIMCTGVMVCSGPTASGHILPLFQLNSSDYRGGWYYNYGSGHSYACVAPIFWSVTGETATGNLAVKIKYGAGGGGGERPFNTLNPNQNDDSRLSGGVYSRATIWEVLL